MTIPAPSSLARLNCVYCPKIHGRGMRRPARWFHVASPRSAIFLVARTVGGLSHLLLGLLL